jgi:cysteine-S-conjugate beta-lyase
MASAFDLVVDRRGTGSLKWTRYGNDVLPLWVADMDFPCPEPVRQALNDAINHGIFGYELPGRDLMEIVATRMHRLYGWDVSPDMVLATPGIVAGFKAAARTVCSPGEGVLIQPPVYHPFFELPKDIGVISQSAQLRQANAGSIVRYETNWEAFESAINSNGAPTRMFLLCHPHNPTGQVYSPADLSRMAGLCLRNDTVICSDEIHSELLLGGAQHTPLAAIHPEIARRSITLVSPSKTFNLVGLFCGFAIIPEPGLRARYRRVLQSAALHVNSLGLIAAKVALGGQCDPWLAELRQYLTENRDVSVEFVRQKLPGVRVTVPDATYLAWMDFSELQESGRIPQDPYSFLLQRAKVALNPGSEFGPGGQSFVRLNFGCPRETLLEALERIRAALGS